MSVLSETCSLLPCLLFQPTTALLVPAYSGAYSKPIVTPAAVVNLNAVDAALYSLSPVSRQGIAASRRADHQRSSVALMN